ncbi:uncharacterized protein ACIBXB_015333 isoform 1-T6 [Morphnus guianensis]
MPLCSLCQTAGRFPSQPPAVSPAPQVKSLSPGVTVTGTETETCPMRVPGASWGRERMAGLEATDGLVTGKLRPGVPGLAFLSSAARPQGRFGGSPAETQGINRKELSARVQLRLFPDICSPSGSKEVPVPLDGTVCGSPSRMQERGTPAWHRDPQPGFSPLVSGLASLEAPDCTTGELCVCLPGRERLRVRGSGGLCV